MTMKLKIMKMAKTAHLIACFCLLSSALAPLAAEAREEIIGISNIDGGQNRAFFIPPAKPTEIGQSTLVVYSHGMLSNIEEPFVVPPGAPTGPVLTSIYPHYGFLSVGRPEAWASPAMMKDITDTITKIQDRYHFNR